jgi:hypothetical protein
MRSCKECKNAIFVEKLGEYKCSKRTTTVKPEVGLRCRMWEKGTPGKSKVYKEEE